MEGFRHGGRGTPGCNQMARKQRSESTCDRCFRRKVVGFRISRGCWWSRTVSTWRLSEHPDGAGSRGSGYQSAGCWVAVTRGYSGMSDNGDNIAHGPSRSRSFSADTCKWKLRVLV